MRHLWLPSSSCDRRSYMATLPLRVLCHLRRSWLCSPGSHYQHVDFAAAGWRWRYHEAAAAPGIVATTAAAAVAAVVAERYTCQLCYRYGCAACPWHCRIARRVVVQLHYVAVEQAPSGIAELLHTNDHCSCPVRLAGQTCPCRSMQCMRQHSSGYSLVPR